MAARAPRSGRTRDSRTRSHSAAAHRSAGEHDGHRHRPGVTAWCNAPTASRFPTAAWRWPPARACARLPCRASGCAACMSCAPSMTPSTLPPHSTAARRQGAPFIVIGGGFIGLEVAATARKLGLQVTVLEGLSRLMSRVVAPIVSEAAAQRASRPRRAAGVRRPRRRAGRDRRRGARRAHGRRPGVLRRAVWSWA